jgi:nicotinamidase-related amidase
VGAVFLLLACGGCERPTTGARIPVYDRPQVALVVLDFQKDFLDPGGRLPVAADQVDPMLATTNRLVRNAGPLGVDVIYVSNAFSKSAVIGNWLRHGAAIENEPGATIDPRLTRVNDRVFAKQRDDAFSNSDLDAFLRSRAIDHLVLTGVFADACIFYTAQGAMNRGYKVQVVRDAVAAASEARRDRALEALRRQGVEIIEGERVVAEWARRKRYLASH